MKKQRVNNIKGKSSVYYEVFDYLYNDILKKYWKNNGKKPLITIANRILKEYNICNELYYPILDEIVDMGRKEKIT